MAKKYELIEIDPKDISFNPSNPRGERANQIQEDPTFSQLVDSVYKYGVLVPIVVHRQGPPAKKPYRLVDGERRLRAALKTSTSRIPAHVARKEPAEDDLIQAFHIHMLRKQWSNTAQARAVKLLIKQIQSRSDYDDTKLLERLQTVTGYGKTRLTAMLRATQYPESVYDDIDSGKLAWSHLVQFEESFVEPLRQTFPDLLTEFGDKKIRTILLEKAKRKILTSTRSLMENIVPVVARSQTNDEKNAAKRILRTFITNKDFTAEDVLAKYEQQYPAVQGILEIIDAALKAAEDLQRYLKLLPGVQAFRSYPARTRDLLLKLDEVHKLIVMKRRVGKDVLG